ncbi:MAG: hypothetical protein ABJC19_09535 [Gemmatimonadota bacterium]
MSKSKGSKTEHVEPTAATRRPETPALEGREPLPEELTGRASGTTEDLSRLFANDSAAHYTDGFRGGSDDDAETDVRNLDSIEIATPDEDEPPPA